jgi:hypothetical protein
MKKRLLIACYLSGVFAVFGLFFPAAGNAEINVNIDIPLPGIVITGPPAMVVVPDTYVYFAPDVEADLFFYRGYWYRPYQGRWYISLGYNGPWGGIAIGNVPPALINLPPDCRYTHPGHERMPYGMVQRNWRTWEEERHWDNYEGRDEHARPRHGQGMGRGMGMGM